MEIVYWAPDGEDGKVKRIYLNIPRQSLVDVWMEPIVPSKGYQWDFRVVMATDAFLYQPELRRKLLDSVYHYAMNQLEAKMREHGIPKDRQTLSWGDLIEHQEKLGVLRAKRPEPKGAAADTHPDPL